MQTLTVTEYSRIHIGDRSDPADLVITDAQALRLERMVETLGIPAFSWHRRYLVPQQFVGVYTLGDLRIEVLPKIDQVAREGSGESEVSQQRTCLLELLHWTRRLPIHAAGLSQLHTRQADLLEIYIHVFAEGLLRELRRGVIRRYQIREENLHVVRGKIRFNEQLRRNAIHAERAYCRYQAFHEDHLHNQVLKAASSLLLRQTRNIDTRRQLKTALLLLDRVSEKPIPLMDLRQLIVDRTLTRYAYLLDIAKVVLTGLAHDIAAGQAVQMAVVFDMNKLFEEAVTVALQHALRDDPTLRVRAQSPNRYLLSEAGRGRFLLKPDITVREDEHTRLIMDTKWKRLDKRRTNLGVSQADLYQLYAYAQRYNCADVVLLYPWHEALTTRERQFLIEPVENAFTAERRLWIKTVELAVPKRLPALMKNLIDSITGRVSVVPG